MEEGTATGNAGERSRRHWAASSFVTLHLWEPIMFCPLPMSLPLLTRDLGNLPNIVLNIYFAEITYDNFVLKSQDRSTLIVGSILFCIFHGKVFIKLPN